MSREAEPGMDFTPLVKRLDRAYGAGIQQRDVLLASLRAMGASGLSVGVGLVVDGVMMLGAVGPSQGMADAMADATADAVDGFGFDREPFEPVVQQLRESEETREEMLKGLREVADRYRPDATLDEIAAEDVLKFYASSLEPSTLDLHSAQIFYGQGDPLHIEVVRVSIGSISAWWPLKAQEGANVNYNFNS